jgi:hypothetical protein
MTGSFLAALRRKPLRDGKGWAPRDTEQEESDEANVDYRVFNMQRRVEPDSRSANSPSAIAAAMGVTLPSK